MQTGKSTIKDVFDGFKIFNVPIYQRAFSWEVEDNLKDFMNDVKNQRAGNNYFLGSFLFHLKEQHNEYVIIDIVDGQQRLTTFLIFINILIRKLIKENSKFVSSKALRLFIKDEEVYKFQTSNEDSAFIHNYILSPSSTQQKPSTHSQYLLLKAREYFENEIAKLDLPLLEKIYKTCTSAEVLLYVVDKINAATQIFELLNDRGRKLTDLEALKSFLMYHAGLVSKLPNQTVADIQTDFANIYRKSEEYQIAEADVLRYHTIAFEACPADMLEKPKDHLKSQISQQTFRDCNCSDTLNYITSLSARLKRTFDLFAEIQSRKNSQEKLGTVFMIQRVAPFYPLMLRALSEGEDAFQLLLDRIVQFTFRASMVGLRSNGESYLYTAIRNNEDYSAKLNCFIMDNWWNINNRASEAVELVNYYEWLGKNTVRFILVSYENSLRSIKGFPKIGYKEYFTDIEREKLSIEHITAQRCKGIVFDEDFEANYLHSIGNLVIDCLGSNSIKGNKNPADKISEFTHAPIMSQNEIDQASDVDWRNIESIKRFIGLREKHLKQFIRDFFGISHKLQ